MTLVNGADRQIGQFSVGPIGFGTWRFVNLDLDSRVELIRKAIDTGANLIDCADVYGLDWGGQGFGDAEKSLGEVFAADPSLRAQVVLATKGGIIPGTPYDSSDSYLRAAVNASLSRLQVETIDLYQLHRPDMYTHPAAVAATLVDLRQEGKIQEVGVSNYSASQFSALDAHLPFKLVSTQPQFSAAVLDPMRDGTLDMCMERRVVPLAWSPLAGGRLLTGENIRPELLEVLDRLAIREGVDRSTIALAFVLAHPSAPVVLLGSTKASRLVNAKYARNVNLDRTDCYCVVEAAEGQSLP